MDSLVKNRNLQAMLVVMQEELALADTACESGNYELAATIITDQHKRFGERCKFVKGIVPNIVK